MSQRLARFFYGTPNLVGMGLALFGLGLFLSGLINSYWVFIVLGLYAAGYLATPHRAEEIRRIDEHLEGEMLLNDLDRFLGRVGKHLSAPVKEQLDHFQQSAKAVLLRLDRLGTANDSRHAVRQTIARYLPEMIQDYLELPPAYARFHVIQDGKTARDLLLEQLQLLNAEFDAILDDLHSEQIDRLKAHGAFLKQRFNRAAELFSNG